MQPVLGFRVKLGQAKRAGQNVLRAVQLIGKHHKARPIRCALHLCQNRGIGGIQALLLISLNQFFLILLLNHHRLLYLLIIDVLLFLRLYLLLLNHLLLLLLIHSFLLCDFLVKLSYLKLSHLYRHH